jgi:signal transduction histidine kinase
MHKLDDTLKEILEYARNARQDLIIEEISMNTIIADNLERMQYMPGSSKILKDVIIDEQSPFYSDKYRLSVVVNNLVSNAIKYYDPSKDNSFLRIFIQINKERAVMEFEDNGIGIHANYVKKVFDMFFRATERNNGDGLGLYIVREAITKLKGTIDVKSKIREGTLFRIEIPNELTPESALMINENNVTKRVKATEAKSIVK